LTHTVRRYVAAGSCERSLALRECRSSHCCCCCCW